MSVVTGQSRARWVAVAVGVVLLAAVPPVTSSAASWVAGRSAATPSTQGLLAAVRASESVPYSGLAEIRGGLALPDLPRFGDVVAELGGTTRARVWWSGARAWRVSVGSTTGEQSTYRAGDRLVTWDYEESRLTDVQPNQAAGSSSVRLPRADDLLPPEAARRLLAAIGPADRVEPIAGILRIAGIVARGLRVVPADPHATIGRIDVWADPATGLPVQVTLIDSHGATGLTSRFLDLSVAPPAAQDFAVPAAPGAVHDATTSPDLVSRIDQFGPWQLPAALAGLASSAPVAGGTATYGSGLARFVVVPLTGRFGAQLVTTAHTNNGQPLKVTQGDALLVSSGMLTVVVAHGTSGRASDPNRYYLIAGLVTPALLTAATQELFSNPPPRRGS